MAAERGPREPKLYCSGDLIGSLRHAQLKVAGAPRLDTDFVSEIRMRTGTLWHDYIAKLLLDRGATFMQEVRLSDWLPEGWGGRADHLMWDPEARAFDLWDVKTVKGEGLAWVSDGVKDEHLWQGSAYWHALRAGKFPMHKRFFILYLPITDAGHGDPIVQECKPLPKDKVWGVMESRWAATKEYLAAIDAERERWSRETGEHPLSYPTDDDVLNDKLAPPMERIQKLYKNGDKYELKMVPHWSTRFCPFPDELCDCNTQGTTKVGEWKVDTDFDNTWAYFARKGYEDTYPELSPNAR